MSALPEEEAMYPLGQQFEVMACGHKSPEDLGELLAVPIPTERPSHMVFVAELRAVDVFWKMAADLCADGGTTSIAEVVIKRRLAADLRTYVSKHPIVAVGYCHLARHGVTDFTALEGGGKWRSSVPNGGGGGLLPQ